MGTSRCYRSQTYLIVQIKIILVWGIGEDTWTRYHAANPPMEWGRTLCADETPRLIGVRPRLPDLVAIAGD